MLRRKRRPGRLAEYDSGISEMFVTSLRAHDPSYEEAFDKLAAGPPLQFDDWTDEELAELISRNPTTAPAIMAASEVRSREAWRTPAKWALIVALASFGLAATALIRTL